MKKILKCTFVFLPFYKNGNTALHIVAGLPDLEPDLKLITYFLDSNCDTSIRNFEVSTCVWFYVLKLIIFCCFQ